MGPVLDFFAPGFVVEVPAAAEAAVGEEEEVVLPVVVEEVWVEVVEEDEWEEDDVEEWEEEDEEEVELVLEEDVELGFADIGVKFTPVYTIWRSISVGCPAYVVATWVAWLDAPQLYW
jgi:hypothetical protein